MPGGVHPVVDDGQAKRVQENHDILRALVGWVVDEQIDLSPEPVTRLELDVRLESQDSALDDYPLLLRGRQLTVTHLLVPEFHVVPRQDGRVDCHQEEPEHDRENQEVDSENVIFSSLRLQVDTSSVQCLEHRARPPLGGSHLVKREYRYNNIVIVHILEDLMKE